MRYMFYKTAVESKSVETKTNIGIHKAHPTCTPQSQKWHSIPGGSHGVRCNQIACTARSLWLLHGISCSQASDRQVDSGSPQVALRWLVPRPWPWLCSLHTVPSAGDGSWLWPSPLLQPFPLLWVWWSSRPPSPQLASAWRLAALSMCSWAFAGFAVPTSRSNKSASSTFPFTLFFWSSFWSPSFMSSALMLSAFLSSAFLSSKASCCGVLVDAWSSKAFCLFLGKFICKLMPLLLLLFLHHGLHELHHQIHRVHVARHGHRRWWLFWIWLSLPHPDVVRLHVFPNWEVVPWVSSIVQVAGQTVRAIRVPDHMQGRRQPWTVLEVRAQPPLQVLQQHLTRLLVDPGSQRRKWANDAAICSFGG